MYTLLPPPNQIAPQIRARKKHSIFVEYFQKKKCTFNIENVTQELSEVRENNETMWCARGGWRIVRLRRKRRRRRRVDGTGMLLNEINNVPIVG